MNPPAGPEPHDLSRPPVSTIGDADDLAYDPGWLGVVLRWPVRVVAIAVIMPVQVVVESVKAAGKALGNHAWCGREGDPWRRGMDPRDLVRDRGSAEASDAGRR